MMLLPEEELLLQGRCLFHRGPLAHSIEFVLTSHRMWFFPMSFLDRMMGAAETTIPLTSMKEIQMTGIDRIVCLHLDIGLMRFSQGDSQQLFQRLTPILSPETRSGTRKEKQISQDQCLFHRGPLAHTVEVILTAEKLLFYSTNFLDRLTGMTEKTIPAKSIDSVEIKGMDQMLHLVSEGRRHRFSGKGAHRMLPIIKKLIRYHKGAKGEGQQGWQPILSQGTIEIFLLGPLAVKGEFVLTRTELRISTYPGLVSKILGKVDLSLAVENNVEIIEGSTQQKLGIRHKDGTIWVGGKKAAVMHFFLSQLKG
jgi:hypothetical protein